VPLRTWLSNSLSAGTPKLFPGLPFRSWVKALADDPQHAFPGQSQMKPEQLEIAQLKREVIRLKAERDILKKAAAYFAKEST
jgi:transposase